MYGLDEDELEEDQVDYSVTPVRASSTTQWLTGWLIKLININEMDIQKKYVKCGVRVVLFNSTGQILLGRR